jgi:hypothetical protein
MTKEKQREIWRLKAGAPEIRHIPDAIIYALMKRAEISEIMSLAKEGLK